MSFDPARIRNFSIIAHIDHGKSTLADRILFVTGALTKREEKAQFLDKMELEQERGITIKAQSVRLLFTAADGLEYQLNLIDTPGHVDFTYEVSRSLAACEGALLVVDATQGVEAQTLANVYLAVEQDLEVIPVLNKIDLPSSDVERVEREVTEVVGIDASHALHVSAKTGEGVPDVLQAVVDRVPAPSAGEGPLRALIFDSWYDSYRGAVVMVRVVDGHLRKGEKVKLMATGAEQEVTEVGVYTPFPTELTELGPGEVGYFSAAIKSIHDTKIGDTVTTVRNPAVQALEGFHEVKPMVFCGIFPVDSDKYPELRDALDKLHLNDGAFLFEPETSDALGFGFRCGFLGLLHMEIVQERLEREFGVDLITTVPNVEYHVTLTDGTELRVENPASLPDRGRIESIAEPVVRARIVSPSEYIGNVQKLCHERRGIFRGMHYLDPRRVELEYELPLAEIVLDFYDRLKGGTRGYAGLDYEFLEFRPADLVRLDILVNGTPVDAFSVIIHREKAYEYGRSLVVKLKKLIPRQQFEVALQAAIGSQVIARTNVKALRKHVTAKCYGGDVTRKRKLLERQKEGKRRMKQVGSVEIPQEAFLAILSLEE